MENLTLLVGLLAAIAVVVLPPRRALGVLLCVLLIYPTYLRIVTLGTTWSAARMAGCALFMRCLLDARTRGGFRWKWLDTAIVLNDLVCMTVMAFGVDEAFVGIRYYLGVMVDTTVTYFCVRFCLRSWRDLAALVQGIAPVLVVLAIMGAYEAKTSRSPFLALMQHRFYAERSLGFEKFELTGTGHAGERRHGFYRATGPHPHPIVFGLSFVVFLPLAWGCLRHIKGGGHRKLLSIFIALGALSSMSSGPIVGLLFVVLGMVLEKRKRWVKTLTWIGIAGCVAAEVATRRPHFYYAIVSRLAFDEVTGYDRCKLIDAALEHLREYWLLGYGLKDPGWGVEAFGTPYTDLCVHYVYVACLYGIFGLLCYLVIVGSAIKGLSRTYRASSERGEKDTAWAVAVGIVAILGTNFSTSQFGAVPALSNFVLGAAGTLIWARKRRLGGGPAATESNSEKELVAVGATGRDDGLRHPP